MSTELTVIIPFRNEGIEVFKTIESLINTASSEFNIILINDGSNDGFNYSEVTKWHNVTYIVNAENIGPARSIDYGVSLCTTEYFLLMDAHMRALTPGWDTFILSALKLEKRAIFCCMTCDLGDVSSNTLTAGYGMGTILNLENLSYSWNTTDMSPEQSISIIPCVMGASYCSNVKYWNKIHGLEGLYSYGYEEQLLSIKTLLEGGNCYIIKTVKFAHKFRKSEEVPYNINNSDYIYNILYIIELFYPKELKQQIFQTIKKSYNNTYIEKAIKKLSNNQNNIYNLKQHYANIFSEKFNRIIELNNKFKMNTSKM